MSRVSAAGSMARDADRVAPMNAKMVERLKTSGAIRSPAVEQAFRATPRHLFLPGVGLDMVYSGTSVVTRSDPQLGITSSSSEVGIMAPMLEALALEAGHRVLEIGAGTGYNAALLDELVGPSGQVVTVDVQADVANDARQRLEATGHARVRVVAADGFAGHPDGARYDRIIATASVRDIPLAWRDQLREGGLLVLPLRLRPGSQMVVTFTRRGERLESVSVIGGGFMPLRTDQQLLERPLTLEGDWEIGLVKARDGDTDLLAALLRQEPVIEPFRSVPWYVTFSLLSLADPDWISVRHAQRYAPWVGVLDRASRGLALLWNVPVPMSSTPRTLCLRYGSPAAREKLDAAVAALDGVALDGVRVSAIPRQRPQPEADILIEGDSFWYAIVLRDVTRPRDL
jgi:protein-L-isoaspartate(D-aspartate) O-methyltransferase